MANVGRNCRPRQPTAVGLPVISCLASAEAKIENQRSRIKDNESRHPVLSSIFPLLSSILNPRSSLILLWLIAVPPILAQEPRVVIDSLRVAENYLVVDFHADSLLNRHLLTGMQRGFTSAAQFRVQLWRKRKGWFGSTLLAERQYEIKSTYDPWERKYLIITAEERRLTSAMELLRRRWEQHHGVALAEVAKLHPARRHFVTVELLVEPISKESLNEIRGWLAGEVKSVTQRDTTNAAVNKKRKEVPDRLLELIINLTGFGKRAISAKSGIFWLTENGEIEMKKELR